MKISVIITTYNRADFILKAIESVKNQTYKAKEIIVIDDGSTDNTTELLKLYDIRYVYQQNSGVSSARNKGIKLALYDWIAFLDSDDIWHSDKLSKQNEFHNKNQNILMSHTDEVWKFNNKIKNKNKDQQKLNTYSFTENLKTCKIGPSTVLIHKKIFHDIGYFDESLIVCEDYDLWLRILIKHKIGFINEELITKVSGHNNQLSFSVAFVDLYKIQALEKHINSIYKQEVLEVLVSKYKILIKGAKKHNNLAIFKKYSKALSLVVNK